MRQTLIGLIAHNIVHKWGASVVWVLRVFVFIVRVSIGEIAARILIGIIAVMSSAEIASAPTVRISVRLTIVVSAASLLLKVLVHVFKCF